jgi:hypothetical protein
MGSPLSGTQMPDQDSEAGALRARARERIQQGRLPRNRAARTWGGLGSGLPCDLCDAPILANEPEFELQLELSSSSAVVRFHRECHAIWESARADVQQGWVPIEQTLPAADQPVEVRVSLSDARSVILNLIRVQASSGGDAQWLNAATLAALPEGWEPTAWRPLSPGQPQTAAPAPEIPSLPKRA